MTPRVFKFSNLKMNWFLKHDPCQRFPGVPLQVYFNSVVQYKVHVLIET